ncbi:MAG: hypothetical protein IKY67_05860 [Paludibacteraceae bacterium]|nr:hypothetical protein [Paludibacteraceae bacterium]
MQDKNFAYNVGDEYPRKGLNVLQSRINELASKKNRRGEPLIVEVEEPKVEEPKKKSKSVEQADEE